MEEVYETKVFFLSLLLCPSPLLILVTMAPFYKETTTATTPSTNLTNPGPDSAMPLRRAALLVLPAPPPGKPCVLDGLSPTSSVLVRSLASVGRPVATTSGPVPVAPVAAPVMGPGPCGPDAV